MSSDYYFRRFGFCERQITAPPRSDLRIVVVIPCYNEPDLVGSLESLWLCDRPSGAVEVIVVVNSPADCAEAVRRQNQKTLEEASAWIADHPDVRLSFHLLHFPALPPKDAGVGLARKIGMDEAVRRFDDIGQSAAGLVVGFDADCRCRRNYLRCLETHFKQNPKSPGCSIYFEHPLSGPLEGKIYEAIAAYELHLRYYVQALRYAGFPYAYHTVGSCMAVRAHAYKAQGGMNKRQAGEDFYFLQKIMPLGGFTNLTTTTVVPSPRLSDRVPFGTGKAVADFLREEKAVTYPLEAFRDLRMLFTQVPLLFRAESDSILELRASLPETARTFLEAGDFEEALKEIRANTTSELSFRKRFFGWFDGFKVMKFVHHARDRFYGEQPMAAEVRRLFAIIRKEVQPPTNPLIREWLRVYRHLERSPNPSDRSAAL